MGALEEARGLLETRKNELRPLVVEYDEIERKLAALDGRPVEPRRQTAYRPAATRKKEIREMVEASPGIRVTDVAGRMGITIARVVQLVNVLEAEGHVKRGPQGLEPARSRRPKVRATAA